MSKIAVSGYYGFENFGDETILFVLLENLKKYGHEACVFSKNPQVTSKKYNVKSVQTFSLLQIFKTLWNVDVLVSGGGSLLQDATSAKSLVYYLFVLMTAQFFRKKTVIFAQGIGPIHNSFLRFLTKKVLKKADYLSVRDDKSLFLLRGWGLNPTLVNDPVWGLNLPLSEKKEFISIQLRDWHSLSDDFLMELAEIIAKKYPLKTIRLFSFQNLTDLPVCGKFRNYILQNNPLMKVEIIKNESIQQVIYELSRSELLIAMRYHALLLGIKSGIKSFALCYDIKVQNIAEEHNVPYCVLNETKKIKDFLDNEDDKDKVYTPINKTFSFEEFNSVL